MSQITSNILMIKPVQFGFNEDTATNNYFQNKPDNNRTEIQKNALKEFENMVSVLSGAGINVIVIEDTFNPLTPDSIFPNNWISFHQDGNIGIYPMYAKNRRLEKREDILEILEEKGFIINEIIDYSEAEKENIFLEGTGSFILDRENKMAYASISERTDEELFVEFCEDFEYTPIVFHSYQTVNNQRLPIYHTNVMMCVADQYCVICLDAIDDKKETKLVLEFLKKTHKEIIPISEEQMHQFSGNMLQVKGQEKCLVMSETAYNSLNDSQIKTIEKYNPILKIPIPTIEKVGGGSVRCMMAEVFLPYEY